MKRFGVIAIVVIVIVVLVAMLGVGLKGARERSAGNGAEDVKVSTGTLSREVIETGKLESVKTVEVKSRVGGRVATLFVDEGDLVEQGQLVAIIDPEETELRVKQDRARLDGAEASMSRLSIEIAAPWIYTCSG